MYENVGFGAKPVNASCVSFLRSGSDSSVIMTEASLFNASYVGMTGGASLGNRISPWYPAISLTVSRTIMVDLLAFHYKNDELFLPVVSDSSALTS